MPEPIEKEIHGTTFVLTPFGARKGLDVLTRLMKLVDLGELDKTSIGKDSAVSMTLILDCLKAVQRSISSEILAYFLDEFEESCTWKNDDGVELPLHRHGKVHHADRIFSQNYAAWLEWCWWVLEVNYSSFFVGIKSEIPDR